MLKLKELALKAGFRVPYYTATGWGGAYVPEGETLPVLGGYVDAPWAAHVEEMPACEGFLFSSYKRYETIGSDLSAGGNTEFTFDTKRNPYLTAELGGGLQVTAHRRTYPWPEDIEAQALCYLGGGANLLGYYMYHGGVNPDGKYSTLQESRDTGYANDLPVKSYDFQACIRESGEINESFGRLKRLHLLLQDFGEVLAGAAPFFPEVLPSSPEDLDTLRVAARVNIEEGVGFLFLNNHQRKRHMKAHEDFAVRLLLEGGGEKLLSSLSLPSDACAVIPFLLPDAGERWKNLLPAETNASLLCRLGRRLFFYTDGWEPACRWDGTAGNAVFLSGAEAERAFRAGGKLYITERPDSCLIEKAGKIRLITKAVRETLLVYGEEGGPEETVISAGTVEPGEPAAQAFLQREETEEDGSLLFREYRIKLEAAEETRRKAGGCLRELYLELPFEGDRAEAYLGGRLIADWFTNGETWRAALRRYGFPQELMVRVYDSGRPIPNPYGNRVYYDLPVVPGCALGKIRLLREYEIEI